MPSLFTRIEGTYSRTMMRLLGRTLGPGAATGWMTYFPLRRRTKARLLWLHDWLSEAFGPDEADRMVLRYLAARPRPNDYRTLLCQTNGHRLAASKLHEAMPAFVDAAQASAARLTGLAFALVERNEIRTAAEVLTRLDDKVSTRDVSLKSNFKAIFPRPIGGGLPASVNGNVDIRVVQPPPCRSRLLVIDGQLSAGVVRFLAHGADRLTIIRYGDVHGLADLTEIRQALPDLDISIQHARTRIGRFQNRYYELHRASEEISAELAREFIAANPWIDKEIERYQGFEQDLTLEISDRMFFKMLRMDGVLQAIRDPEFDSVIVSFSSNFEMFRLCAAEPGLVNDPRVLACCWTNEGRAQAKFTQNLRQMHYWAGGGTGPLPVDAEAADEDADGATAGAAVVEPVIRQTPPEVADYLRRASDLAPPRAGNRMPGRQSVALITQEGRAYGYDAMQIALSLQDSYNVDVVWTFGKEPAFQATLNKAILEPVLHNEAHGEPLRPSFQAIPALAPDSTARNAVNDTLRMVFQAPVEAFLARWPNDPAIACAVDCLLTRGLTDALLLQVGKVAAAANFFKRKSYDMVAVCPARTGYNAVFAGYARHLGIPTLTIEPHCLNAAYCRYTTVTTDYAAVYSEYYVADYERHFGIARDRCFPFGSPRVLRPVGYDSAAERLEARARLGFGEDDDSIVAVPTQPMPASHILPVWRMIIRSAKALGRPVKVLLKAHPEEGQGQVELYRQIIAEEGAEDICAVVECDIKDLIKASHLILTGYSVTALEAVVLDRNVAIVGQPGVEYPIAYDEIIGLPFCVTEAETLVAIREALDLGLAAPSGAQAFRAANPYLFDNSTFDRLKGIVADIIARGPAGMRPQAEMPKAIFVTAPFREYMV